MGGSSWPTLSNRQTERMARMEIPYRGLDNFLIMALVCILVLGDVVKVAKVYVCILAVGQLHSQPQTPAVKSRVYKLIL